MKLLHKTTRLQLVFTVLIMAVASVVLFFVLKGLVNEELDEQLMLKARRQVQLMAKTGARPTDPFTRITTDESHRHFIKFSDTTIYDPLSREKETYRQLLMNTQVNGRPYRIWVASSRLEWEDFYQIIFLTFLGMAFTLLMVSVIIQNAISRKLWSPFFHNLKVASHHSIKTDEPLMLEDSSIKEFRELKATLENLIRQAQNDYRTLRIFTENASHEIQTPLAIILAKLDRLSQHPSMDESMAAAIQDAHDAANRLSKLNRNLLLLTKLNNKQFNLSEAVPVDKLILGQLSQLDELFASHDLQVKSEITPLQIPGNMYLTEILINNLLSNALRYSNKGTIVRIMLNGQMLMVNNAGQPLPFPEETLFNRFQKGDASMDGAGLGLAIVKEICEINDWRIAHQYEDSHHIFSIHFKL